MKEVYIDCASVVLSEFNTGIQRVERNIITESIKIAKSRGVQFQPVCLYNKDSYIKFDLSSDYAPTKFYLYKIRLSLNEFWRFRRLIKSVFPNKKINKWIDLNWISWKKWVLLFPFLIISMPSLLMAYICFFIKLDKKIWKSNSNQILIIPGPLWWHNNNYMFFVNKLKSNGCQIITLIYDIIPITHPKYFDKQNCNNFNSKFPLISEISDIIITISQSEKKRLEKYFITNPNYSNIPKIEYFRLGCDLDIVKKNPTIRDEIVNLFTIEAQLPYLCVGTVEPRKNHKYLLDAFDKLWSSRTDLKLCIVGRHGWLVDDLVKRIYQHPQYGISLFWFKDLTDDELVFCYENARCLIFPSIVEGFGLPLVEALNNQCPVMASDIPVFREIGGEHCAYFSLENIDDLIKLIDEFEINGKLHGITQDINDFHWPNWKESTENFWDVLYKHLI